MRILFLNQYFPPDHAPTGVLLHELGEQLKSEGHTVEFIASPQSYRSAKKGRRIVREFRALASIFWRGWKTARADVIFSASSPPCLLVAAALIAKLHHAKSVHWLMDMYPELAVALGEVKPGFIPGVIGKLMGWAYRRTNLVVALDEDMADRLKKYRVRAEIIQPWILQPLIKNGEIVVSASSRRESIPENESLRMQAAHSNLEFIDLSHTTPVPEIAAMVSSEMALKYHVIPIAREGESLTIAIGDPLDFETFDALGFLLKRPVKFVCATLRQIQAALVKYYGAAEETEPGEMAAASSFDRQWTWMYSGNLGRAHEWETLLAVQAELEKRGLPWRLIFQGGGPSWPLAQARAKELKLNNCDWKDYAPEAELQLSLLRSRVLVVTQKPETQGLLWPSKLALVSTLPRPILWVGPMDGAIARSLASMPRAGIFAPGHTGQIADWLEKLYKDGDQPAQHEVADAALNRKLALQKWSSLLAKL